MAGLASHKFVCGLVPGTRRLVSCPAPNPGDTSEHFVAFQWQTRNHHKHYASK